MRWYRGEGLDGLSDRSHRPTSHPAQTSPEVEAAICELRRTHPRWGQRRIEFAGCTAARIGEVSGVRAGDIDRQYDLRHTGLAWMADAGVPVHVLRKIAGHGSRTTTQRYLHPDRQSINAAGLALSVHLPARRSPASRGLGQETSMMAFTKQPLTWAVALVSGRWCWSGRRDLNPRPLDPQSSALPNCATSRCRPGRAARTA